MPEIPHLDRAAQLATIAAITLALCARPALAQDGLFLIPDRFEAAAGDVVRLGVAAREPGVARVWPTQLDWFFVRVAGTQENRDGSTLPARAGAAKVPAPVPVPAPAQAPALAPDVMWTLQRPGETVFGVDARVPAREWRWGDLAPIIENDPKGPGAAHLANRNAPPPESPVRVSVRESAKAVVSVRQFGDAPPDTSSVSKTGQAAEIRPLFDPAHTPPGGDLGLRAYLDGAAAGGVIIIARQWSDDGARIAREQRIATDGSGIGYFRVEAPGVWRLEFRRAVPASDGAWTVYDGTLVFRSTDEIRPGVGPTPMRGSNRPGTGAQEVGR